MVIGDKVYLGDEDGDVAVLQVGKVEKVLGVYNMGSSVYSTPVPANGVLFIANRNQLFARKEGAMTKPAAASIPHGWRAIARAQAIFQTPFSIAR